jgi:60 kDa SS-A/Ro ribonucleoprotein
LQAFGAYYNLYGSVGAKTTKRAKGDYTRMTRIAKLPNSFKKGLAAALSKFDEYQLLKWDSSGAFPTFKDVVLTVDRKGDYPINRSLVATWLNGGEIVNALETPLLAARKQLSKLKEFNATAQALALAGHVTWEIVLSQFGNTKAVWEFLIDGGKTTLPVMAAVRNLRNMEQADISDAHWKKLRELVLSSDDTKMMPFRFVSARNELTNRHAKGIAEACLDKAVLNLADLPGNTFIMVDHSGSMTSTVSEKSTMTKKDAGTALMAILAKKFGTNCVIGTFGKTFATVDFSVQDSVWRIFEDINKVGATTGHSTEAHLAFKWLLANANKYKADRVIIMSDLQCYNSYGSASLQSLYQQYRQTVNPKCRLVSVDIGGKGTSQVAPDPYVYLSSGYNDSIVKEIVAHEQKLLYNDRTDGGDKSNVPALDYVRTNF